MATASHTITIDTIFDWMVNVWCILRCKNEECSEQLPASWAVRKKDLQ